VSIDLRRIRIGIEINGRANFYEDPGMRVRATGTKSTDPTQNDCTVTITNLSRETRDYILTEASPFNANRTPKRLIVEVGRVSTGLFTLFVGDIVSAEPSDPPDIDLLIKAKTAANQAGNVVAKSAGKIVPLSVIARGVAEDLGLALLFEALDKQIGSYSHTGAALHQVRKLAAMGGVQAFIDDSTLIVKDVSRAIRGNLRILNLRTGMVGLPKATEKGLKVTYSIDGESRIGGALRVESVMNKSLNGDYTINQLSFEVTSHDAAFFYTAQCERIN